jgi:hypothetical protein
MPTTVAAPVPVVAPAPVVAPDPVGAPLPDEAPSPSVAAVPDTAAGEPATDAARARAREGTSPTAPRVATARTPMKTDAPGARDHGNLVVSCARRCTVRLDGAMSPAATGAGARVRPGRHVVIVTDGQTGLALTMHVDVPAGMTLQKRVTF